MCCVVTQIFFWKEKATRRLRAPTTTLWMWHLLIRTKALMPHSAAFHDDVRHRDTLCVKVLSVKAICSDALKSIFTFFFSFWLFVWHFFFILPDIDEWSNKYAIVGCLTICVRLMRFSLFSVKRKMNGDLRSFQNIEAMKKICQEW